MAIPTSSRVYVDSNVWVDLVFEKEDPDGKFEHRIRSTKEFMSDIAKGNLTGVVTTLVIHETVVACRRLLAAKKGVAPSQDEVREYEREIRTVMDKFGVEVRDADALACRESSLGPAFSRAYAISIDSGIHQGLGRNWQYICGIDAIHASLAERANVGFFATHDKAARHMNSKVKPVYLEDEYP